MPKTVKATDIKWAFNKDLDTNVMEGFFKVFAYLLAR